MRRPLLRLQIPRGDYPVIRRKRNILEMAVATALFGACAAGAMPVSHAAQATSTADANGTPATAQTSEPDQNGTKQVANENKLQEVVISGFVSSLQNSLAIQKNSDEIVEAVSAEEIGKLPGTSIADALGRLPGVAMQEVNGRPQDISCHGLGPDFVSVLFNGTLEASTGNNRGVQLDVFPTSWFKQLVVHMTPHAGLFGQGMACTVDLQTIKPLDEKGREATVNASYAWLSPSELMPGPGVNNKGHDVNAIYTNQFFDRTFGVSFGVDQNVWPAHITHQAPWGYPTVNNNLIVGGSKNYNFSDLMKRNGYLATFEFRPSSAYTSTLDLTYSETNETEQAKGAEFPLFSWGSATLTSANTVAGFDQSGTFSNVYPVIRNDYDKYQDYAYNALWRNHFKFADDWTANFDASYNRAEREDFQLESYSGFGYNGPGSNGAVPQMTGSFSESSNGELLLNSPDSLANNIVLTDPQGWGSGSNLAQAGFINQPHTEDYLANVKLTAAHFFEHGPISSVEFGVDRTNRQKSFHIAQDFLVLPGGPGGCLLLSCGATKSAPIPAGALEPTTSALGFMGLGPEVMYNPLALIASGTLVEYPTFMSSLPIPPKWKVKEADTDGYLQFNIDTNLGSDVGLRGDVGVQIAHTSQDSSGARPAPGASTGGSVATALIPQFGGTSYTRVLPSLNLVFSFPGDNDARLGIARTMARPRMDQLNDSQVIGGNITNLASSDVTQSYFSATGGNPQLLPYMATNYNLSLEHYFKGLTGLNCTGNLKNTSLCLNSMGYFQAAAYYLKLTDYVNPSEGVVANFAPFVSSYLDPLQQSQLGTSYGVATQPENNGAGHLEGLQVATNLPLGYVTHVLEDFGVLASANRNLSRVTY